MNNDVNDKLKIKFVSRDGEYAEYKILFTFKCEELDRNYVMFETNEKDSDGKYIIGVSIYDPESGIASPNQITDPDELEMINDVFNEVLESQGA